MLEPKYSPAPQCVDENVLRILAGAQRADVPHHLGEQADGRGFLEGCICSAKEGYRGQPVLALGEERADLDHRWYLPLPLIPIGYAPLSEGVYPSSRLKGILAGPASGVFTDVANVSPAASLFAIIFFM